MRFLKYKIELKQLDNTYDQRLTPEMSVVDSTYILKHFSDETTSIGEILGNNLFFQLTDLVPPSIGLFNKSKLTLNMSNYKSADYYIKKNLISRSQINHMVANFISKVYLGFNFKNPRIKDSIPREFRWKAKSENIRMNFLKNSTIIEGKLGTSKLAGLISNIDAILKANIERTTLLHRDIHLGNILIDLQESYVDFILIDFEHFTEGPIEFEIQNSFFWNDFYSINTNEVIKIINGVYQIKYDKELSNKLMHLYFADQVNIAILNKDLGKVDKLISQYNKL